jgi:tRNA(fMet)-specific endonuclease VapC
MSYLLDTNTCIAYLNGRAVGVRRRLQALPPAEVTLCSVVKAELLYGASKSTNPPAVLAKLQRFFTPLTSLPFDDAAAQAYGAIRAGLEQAGTPIGPNDLMIAAIALAGNAQYRRVSARGGPDDRGLGGHAVSRYAAGITAYLDNGGTLEHAQQPFAEGFGLQAAPSAEG